MIIKKIKHWSSVAGMTVKVFIEKCLFVTHSPPCAFIWFDFPVSVTRSSGFVICWSSKSSLNFSPNSTLITTLKESVAFFRKMSFFWSLLQSQTQMPEFYCCLEKMWFISCRYHSMLKSLCEPAHWTQQEEKHSKRCVFYPHWRGIDEMRGNSNSSRLLARLLTHPPKNTQYQSMSVFWL